MTYLFIVIGISLINALSNKKMSFSELILANSIILFATYCLEKYWSKNLILTKVVNYENIENIHPNNHDKLKSDLESRLGIEIIEFEIGDVNFLRDTANVTIKYKK
jgi:DNA replication protein DnaD